jgi:hypothetical protein
LILYISGYDALLDFDWLVRYDAIIDCVKCRVRIRQGGLNPCTLSLRAVREPIMCVSAVKAFHLLQAGCTRYLAAIICGVNEKDDISSMPVVCEFPDVFPDEITDMPPQREVEFGIELVPGTTPISKAPYRMAPTELKELEV